MNWTDLKTNIYLEEGSLRDIYVFDTTAEDWKKWIDYVNKNYRIDWFNAKTETNHAQVDFAAIEEYWNGEHDQFPVAKVFVDNIQINAHFFDDTEIQNDIDPKEFHSIEDHEKLLKYMTDLSVLLGKTVVLTPESTPDCSLMTVTKDSVSYINN